jgi:hypothetical protein
MKKYSLLIITVFLFMFENVISQTGIGTSSPDASSILTINSLDKGMLLPRLNLGERRLINFPANGLLIFNTTFKNIEVNSGTASQPFWTSVTGSQGFSGISTGTGVSGVVVDPITLQPIDVLNYATGPSSYIGGGVNNSASGAFSVIGGGTTNFTTGAYSVVAGGSTNEADGIHSTIAGGTTNNVSGDTASVSGGTTNNASGMNSSIGGCTSNNTSGINAHIGGGSSNNSPSINSSIGGGVSNLASGANSSISGGTSNIASGAHSTVSGGTSNQALGLSSSIGGGTSNIANGVSSTVGGGTSNIADGFNTTVGGGTDNRAYDIASTISGGTSNRANASYSSISGGTSNISNGDYSSVSGGFANFSNSYGEWTGGLNSPSYVANSTTEFSVLDRIFNIGCGSSFEIFSLYKNGLATLPNATIAGIESEIKAITTKAYTNATYSRISMVAPLSATAPGFLGEIRITPQYMYTCVAINSWVRTEMNTW